jgi:putative membrane protein
MHWLARVAITTAGNALALWAVNRYVPGFAVSMDWGQLLLLALVLAILNFVLKPILDLIFAPVIIITLGFGVLIVNGIIVWLLPIIATHIDFLHGSISIQSILALAIGTIIISIVNFIIHLAL